MWVESPKLALALSCDLLAGDCLKAVGLEHVDAEHDRRECFRWQLRGRLSNHDRGRHRHRFLGRLGGFAGTTQRQREGAGHDGSQGNFHE
jgi:hypothetical protein